MLSWQQKFLGGAELRGSCSVRHRCRVGTAPWQEGRGGDVSRTRWCDQGGTRVAKRALSSFPGVLGNAFVLLRCQPDPWCHKESPAQQLEELSSLGMGRGADSVLRGASCCTGCWLTPGTLVV